MADMESQIVEALRAELTRQAAEESDLSVEGSGSQVSVQGKIDLEALAMAVAGRVAGGP